VNAHRGQRVGASWGPGRRASRQWSSLRTPARWPDSRRGRIVSDHRIGSASTVVAPI
jgi:hypothetical protein